MTDEVELEQADKIEKRVEVARAELAQRPTPAGPPRGEEFTELVNFAEYLARSSLVPDKLVGKPRDVFVVALVARDLKLPTIASLTQIHVMDGTPSLSAQLMRSIVKREGHKIRVDPSSDDRKATLHGKRADEDEWESATYTIEEAERAGLCQIVDGKVVALSKDRKPLAWMKFTADMLVARASSRLCRRMFEDVLLGHTYTPDEIADAREFNAPLEVTAEQILPPVPLGGLPGTMPTWIERLLTAHTPEEIVEVARPFWKRNDELTLQVLADQTEMPMQVRVEIANQLKARREAREADASAVPETTEAEPAETPTEAQGSAAADPEPEPAEPTQGPRYDADHCWAHETAEPGCTDCAWSRDAAPEHSAGAKA